MRIFHFLLIAVLFVNNSYSQTTNDNRIAALEPQLQQLLTDWKSAGFAVAVVEKNKIIYAKGFGYRDQEKKLPVTPNTLFAIGSCTKAFTSSVIGLLDKDKLVEIDKPVQQYLPQLSFYNQGMTNTITLRDMMSHRTGLPRHDYSWYLFPTSRDSLLQRIHYMEPTAGVRDRWQYNNFMFLLQGVVAEKITGKSWEQNVKSKLLDPLGMSRTNFSVIDMAKDKDASLGYFVRNDSILDILPYYNIDAMGPAGSINSSVTEMANWVSAWINGGKYNGKEILPASYVRDAMSSQMVIASGVPDKEFPDVHFANYGLGWSLASYRGHYLVNHGGNIDGFSANTAFFPTDSIGIIVLSNQNGSVIPATVRNMIADKIFNLSPIDWSGIRKKAADKAKASAAEAKKTAISNRKRGTATSHPLKDYEGIFSHPGYGSFETFLKNDSLFVKVSNKQLWLRHYHYDIFEPFEIDPKRGIDTTAGSNLKFQFYTDAKGDIGYVNAGFEPTLDPLKFSMKPKEVQLSEQSIQKYIGEFDLAGTVVTVYNKGNTVYVLIPGQPDYELVSIGNDKFNLKILQGYSVQFHPDSSGKIIAISFIQPNGIFKAEKKK